MSITTLSVFKFGGRTQKWWAFTQMPQAAEKMDSVSGLRFSKLLGSGAGKGFSLWPDFSTYVFLASWSEASCAREFFRSNAFYKDLQNNSHEHSLVWMKAFRSKGTWQKQDPFSGQNGNEEPQKLGVITRARIKPGLLHRFWLSVPQVSRKIYQQPGRLFSKGIGEWPLVEQATFSIWDNQKMMQNFAYRQEAHKKVVEKTRKLNWYSEELFARFSIEKIEGEPLF